MYQELINEFNIYLVNPLLITPFIAMIISSAIILLSVCFKLAEYDKCQAKKQVKHKIETASMTFIIFVIIMLMLKFNLVEEVSIETYLLANIFGLSLVIISTVLHIISKINIGKHWSNHIEIKYNHKIITTGAYSIVRHPMYSSIIIWLISLSFIFISIWGALATVFIFIPVMYFRAKTEDKHLEKLDKTSFKIFSTNTKLLTPHFDKYTSLFLRILGIILLGYTIFIANIPLDMLIILCLIHLFIGFTAHQANVRFSYRNKSIFLIIIYLITIFYQEAFLLYYVILFFNTYALFFNCPCMIVYNKYHGCPCFDKLKSCIIK